MLDSTYRAGRKLGLPVFALDDLMGPVTRKLLSFQDSKGAGNRPGFRIIKQDAAVVDQRASAYADYERRMTSAWKDARGGDPETGFGENGSLDLQLGDVCTVSTGGGKFGPEGSRGHIKMVNGELTCVADHFAAGGSEDSRDAALSKDEAYRIYDENLVRQWRTGKGD
jgi:hypothetical protein